MYIWGKRTFDIAQRLVVRLGFWNSRITALCFGYGFLCNGLNTSGIVILRKRNFTCFLGP